MSRIARIAGFLALAVVPLPAIAWAQSSGALFDDQAAEMIDEEEAPDEDEIETDRDSFTPATTVVGRGRLVIESAYSFTDNRRVDETHSLPEVISRYGLTDLVELRLGYNYEVGGAGSPVTGNIPDDLEDEPTLEREARLMYGAKIGLSRQNDWVPQSAVILQGFTPTSGESPDTHFSGTYAFGWTLSNDWVWDSAIRYSTGSFEDDRFNVWAPSTVLKVPFGEKWKAHVEYFGIFTDGRAKEAVQHFFSPGVHYLITPDFEFGVRLGWGLNDQSPNFFTNVGGGIRF